MASSKTKKLRCWYWGLKIFSLLLMFIPLIYFFILAGSNAIYTYQKVCLTSSVMIVAILTMIGLVNKITFKSALWIFLLGAYTCIQAILTPLIMIAICQIIDELLITPIYKHLGVRLTINKEIDSRAD